MVMMVVLLLCMVGLVVLDVYPCFCAPWSLDAIAVEEQQVHKGAELALIVQKKLLPQYGFAPTKADWPSRVKQGQLCKCRFQLASVCQAGVQDMIRRGLRGTMQAATCRSSQSF